MIGSSEFIVILVLALLLFGPKKLPELARALGKATAEYHKAAREFDKETEEIRKTVNEEFGKGIKEIKEIAESK
ncbi:MAG: twin-arginine translocase TatA/TatE family subunit [Euryarchaeota archaeon]|nr:twin-arginine translocase TatA/TatE family subunit [Euryarchaeota archaeon]